MELKSIKISGLYGKNYYLPFNRKLNILTGLNGSGKTTILNMISLICNGELREVIEYDFEKLELIYNITDFNKKHFRLIKNKKKNHYDCYLDNHHEVLHIESSIEMKGNKLFIKEFNKRMINIEANELHEFSNDDELKTIKFFLKKDLNSLYIPISRKISFDQKYSLGNESKKSENYESNIDESTKECEVFLKGFVRRLKFKENRTYMLTQKLILKRFFSTPTNKKIRNPNKTFELTVAEREGLEKYDLVKQYNDWLKQYNETKFVLYEEEYNVEKYIDHIMAYDQLSKFKDIVEFIDSRHKEIYEFNDLLDNLKEKVNGFLIDTNKRIVFPDNFHPEADVQFINLDTNKKKSVLNLSSGEKQLFIMLVTSILLDTSNVKPDSKRVLIIDEPELSLHIEWQRQLLNILIDNISDQQLITATHSPEIIGEYGDSCIEVRGVNYYE